MKVEHRYTFGAAFFMVLTSAADLFLGGKTIRNIGSQCIRVSRLGSRRSLLESKTTFQWK